jgi:hypothetical protein
MYKYEEICAIDTLADSSIRWEAHMSQILGLQLQNPSVPILGLEGSTALEATALCLVHNVGASPRRIREKFVWRGGYGEGSKE